MTPLKPLEYQTIIPLVDQIPNPDENVVLLFQQEQVSTMLKYSGQQIVDTERNPRLQSLVKHEPMRCSMLHSSPASEHQAAEREDVRDSLRSQLRICLSVRGALKLASQRTQRACVDGCAVRSSARDR